MKLSDYREKLAENREYVEAEKKMQARFELGNVVLRGRIKRGWSQSFLAKEVGTKQANISRIEAGLANPTLDLIQRLCEVLDLEFRLLEHGQAAVVEMAISSVKGPGETATGRLERVDNQPENLFFQGFRFSSKQGMQEGVLE